MAKQLYKWKLDQTDLDIDNLIVWKKIVIISTFI